MKSLSSLRERQVKMVKAGDITITQLDEIKELLARVVVKENSLIIVVGSDKETCLVIWEAEGISGIMNFSSGCSLTGDEDFIVGKKIGLTSDLNSLVISTEAPYNFETLKSIYPEPPTAVQLSASGLDKVNLNYYWANHDTHVVSCTANLSTLHETIQAALIGNESIMLDLNPDGMTTAVYSINAETPTEVTAA